MIKIKPGDQLEMIVYNSFGMRTPGDQMTATVITMTGNAVALKFPEANENAPINPLNWYALEDLTRMYDNNVLKIKK